MLLLVTLSAVAVITALSVGLALVQFRRITPLAFRCVRCGAEFRQAPRLDFPRACPRCGATDWAQ